MIVRLYILVATDSPEVQCRLYNTRVYDATQRTWDQPGKIAGNDENRPLGRIMSFSGA